MPDPSSKRLRKRPPRIFGEDQLIIPYNYDHSMGNEYIKRIGLKVSTTEEFKYVDLAEFRINGKSANFCLALTDRKLYIIKVKEYDVRRFTEIKLHKFKSIEWVSREEDKSNLDIHTHVPIDQSRTVFHFTRMDSVKASDLVKNLKQVMDSLSMEMQVLEERN